jgi:small subunit ribosomal protein S1
MDPSKRQAYEKSASVSEPVLAETPNGHGSPGSDPQPTYHPASRAEPAEAPAPEEDMGQLMAIADQEARSLRRGELLEGTVVSIDRDGVLVDVGMKSEGMIPIGEVQRLIDEQQLRVGDSVFVIVVQPEGRSDHSILSLNRARSERGWTTLQTAYDGGTIVPAHVQEVNRGGLVAEIEGLRGFIPLGQIASVRVAGVPAGPELDALLAQLVGQTLQVKVLEVNRKRNRLILSERLAAQELRGQRKERLLAELKDGEIRHGRVSGLSDFGAFVDLGGADGLVHLSELAWHSVAHPSDVLSVGQEVDVMVLGVDRERGKISLSLRRTQPEPWATAAERYPVGSLVTGRVARLAAFGAFVRLDDGIEGLIHISELSDRRVQHPRNVLSEGDVVTARVLRVEPDRRRLGLSLRQVDPLELTDGTDGPGDASFGK